MRPFWHPLSTILLRDPPCFATPAVLRMMLQAAPDVELLYAGDRMWPALGHGQPFTVEPLGDDPPEAGQAVLACPEGIPDLLRVAGPRGNAWLLVADADAALQLQVDPAEVIGRARLQVAPPGRRRAARRLWLDLREALLSGPDPADDAARTVYEKYEAQAPFYAHVEEPALVPELVQHIRQRVEGPILVAGSGTGRECFALAEAGFSVTGVDFAPAMVAVAREAVRDRGLSVAFEAADIRTFTPGASFGGVFFTWDLYSFVPGREQRIEFLKRVRSWLRPGGALFLSARVLVSGYQRMILTLQWLRHGGGWGSSHTRWIAPDGRMHRSFVQVFSKPRLRSETSAAGFGRGTLRDGYLVLTARDR